MFFLGILSIQCKIRRDRPIDTRRLTCCHPCTKLLRSLYFAYEVGIISSYLNRIFYWKIAKSRTKDAWELHGVLRTVCENYCSTSNNKPASYDVTALAIIKQRNIKGLKIHCLQSGVVTRNNPV